MAISKTSQKVYEGISKILKENGCGFTKSQAYAVESLIQTIEEATEKKCCEMTEKILEKKDALLEQKNDGIVSTATIEKVNEMVEARVEELKKEIPAVLDYAKMKKMQECMDTIKECVGYRTDEQVEKVAAESAKALHSTKTLIETQAKTITSKTVSLNESNKKIQALTQQIKQMNAKIEASQKQIVEGINKNKELMASNQNLQKKIDESKKINETLEQKRRNEQLKYYLETKIAKYPDYEASLLRNHFKNAKSQAEIDENFQKVLIQVQEKRDSMRKVSAIPVQAVEPITNKISGGETIINEDVGNDTIDFEQMYNESFVDLDKDVISNAEMQEWISKL